MVHFGAKGITVVINVQVHTLVNALIQAEALMDLLPIVRLIVKLQLILRSHQHQLSPLFLLLREWSALPLLLTLAAAVPAVMTEPILITLAVTEPARGIHVPLSRTEEQATVTTTMIV